MTKRKIGFYFLFLKAENIEIPIKENLHLLIDFLLEKSRIERKQDIVEEKVVFMDSCTVDRNENLLKILFKSAKHSYRAPLLDKNTVKERDNPKTINEGEQMKTHLLIKFRDGDAIIFLETGSGMLTLNNIMDYLNRALNMYNEQIGNEEEKIQGMFRCSMIPRDDFREVLQNMRRVSCASVYVDKRILGSEFLNFSEPSEELKEDIILKIKSKRKKDIKQHVYDLLDRYNGSNTQIKRIRVEGKSDNGNQNLIDTDFIIKKEYIEAQQDEDTGEFNTAFLFSQLVMLSRDF